MHFPRFLGRAPGVRSSRRPRLAQTRRRAAKAPMMEALEERTLLSTIIWSGPDGGDWNTASNWIGGTRPGPDDTAQINTSNITINYSSGASDSVGDIQFTGTGCTLSL